VSTPHAIANSPDSALILPSIALIVHGAGRLGSRIASLALEDQRFALRAVVTRDGRPTPHATGPAVAAALRSNEEVLAAPQPPPPCVVVVTSPESGASQALSIARHASAGLLICTTGLSPPILGTFRAEAAHRPVLISPNTSPGIAAVAAGLALLARSLPGYHVSIVEQHHARKADAPSGTALRLGEVLRDAGATLHPADIHAIRAGDIIGEHTVRFTGPGETIEITHRATTRDLFAHGALRLAAALANRPPGLYSTEQLMSG
jgi:4-hydroxy-tetrahydrodipicolinate reductase